MKLDVVYSKLGRRRRSFFRFILASLAMLILQICILSIFNTHYHHHHHQHEQHEQAVESISFDTKPIIYLKNVLRPYTSMRLSTRLVAESSFLRQQSRPDGDENMWEMEETRDIYKYFFEDYFRFHSKQRQNKSTNILIFRPHPTGMGDRFRPFIFAYWCAVISKRLFLVDWRAPFPLSTFLETAAPDTSFFYDDYRRVNANNSNIQKDGNDEESTVVFNSKINMNNFAHTLESNKRSVIMCMHNPPTDGVMSKYAKRKVPFKIRNPLKLSSITRSADFQRAFFHHVFRVSKHIRNDHRYTCQKLGLRCPSLVTSHEQQGNTTTLTHDTNTNDQEGDDNNDGVPNRPYIGVHARLGLGLGEGKMDRFYPLSKNTLVPARCLASRAVRLSLLAGKPALPIFLATDTTDFRDLFRDVVYEISDGRVPVVFGDWDVGHTDRLYGQHQPVGYTFDRKTFPDEWKVVWATYMDLILLGHAEHVLSIFSTFPILAQALGDGISLTQLKPDVCTIKESWL